MRRRLLNLLTALSLLLCVAVVTLWARGYSVPELLGVKAAEMEVIAGSYKGQILIGWQRKPYEKDFEYGYAGQGSTVGSLWEYIVANAAWRFAGFAYTTTKLNYLDSSPTRVVGVPAWFALLLAASMPATWAYQRRRNRQVGKSLCPQCHYDLRATPGRCPECGTSAVASGKT